MTRVMLNPTRADLDRIFDSPDVAPQISDEMAASTIADLLKPNASDSDVVDALVRAGIRPSHTSGDLAAIARQARQIKRGM